jgi:hypothetical protein
LCGDSRIIGGILHGGRIPPDVVMGKMTTTDCGLDALTTFLSAGQRDDERTDNCLETGRAAEAAELFGSQVEFAAGWTLVDGGFGLLFLDDLSH